MSLEGCPRAERPELDESPPLGVHAHAGKNHTSGGAVRGLHGSVPEYTLLHWLNHELAIEHVPFNGNSFIPGHTQNLFVVGHATHQTDLRGISPKTSSRKGMKALEKPGIFHGFTRPNPPF